MKGTSRNIPHQDAIGSQNRAGSLCTAQDFGESSYLGARDSRLSARDLDEQSLDLTVRLELARRPVGDPLDISLLGELQKACRHA